MRYIFCTSGPVVRKQINSGLILAWSYKLPYSLYLNIRKIGDHQPIWEITRGPCLNVLESVIDLNIVKWNNIQL